MNTLVNRPDLAQSMGANAASYVARECSWETVAERYMQFLHSFTQSRASEVATAKGEVASAHKSIADRLARCILDASKAAPHSENYARTHLRRFVKTLELTPRASQVALALGQRRVAQLPQGFNLGDLFPGGDIFRDALRQTAELRDS